MSSATQTPAEVAAAAKSLQAQTVVRALKKATDHAVDLIADLLADLTPALLAARAAVGSDTTRPNYSDDLGKLNVQARRIEILRDALKLV